jgi:protein-tyrosine phosphatase
MKVLFVCTGNICRSPTAAAVLRGKAAARRLAVLADSAGTHGYHIGNEPDPRTREAAKTRGYSMAGMKARQIGAADFSAYDLVVAMDRGHFAILERMAPRESRHKLRLFMDYAPKWELRDVRDPYFGAADGFEHVLDVIEDGAEAMLDEIERHVSAERKR